MDSLQLPDSLEVLDESAFFKCCNLTSVVIPPNVRYLGKWIFHGCNRLQYLEIRHDPEFIGEWIINRATTVRCYQGSRWTGIAGRMGFRWSICKKIMYSMLSYLPLHRKHVLT